MVESVITLALIDTVFVLFLLYSISTVVEQLFFLGYYKKIHSAVALSKSKRKWSLLFQLLYFYGVIMTRTCFWTLRRKGFEETNCLFILRWIEELSLF